MQNETVYKISDLMEIIGGGTPKTSNPDYWGGDIPWLSVVDFNNMGRWVYNTEKSITSKGLKESSTKILKKGQLIISARGTVGVIAQLGRDMAFNQSCYGLNANTDLISNDFLYYALKNAVEEIKRNSHGGIFSTITKSTFDFIKIRVPPISEQTKITKLLGVLDEKIQLNNQMNKTLESIASTLFKSWFVDFDPVRAKMAGREPELPSEIAALFPDKLVDSPLGEIPAGWNENCVYSCAEFVNGAAYKNIHFTEKSKFAFPVIKIAELKNGVNGNTKYTEQNLGDKYLLNRGDVLFSWSGSPETSIDIFLWIGDKAWLNQHIFKVVPHSYEDRPFIFFLLKNLKSVFIEIAKNKQTTGLGHVTVADLKFLKVPIPSGEIMKEFFSIAFPILNLMELNLGNMALLNKTRELLLPKLIAGELHL